MKIPLTKALKTFSKNGQPVEHSRRLLKSYIATRELRVYSNCGFVCIHSPYSIEGGLTPSERESWSSENREISGIETLISLDPKIEWDQNIVEIEITDTRSMNNIQKNWRGEYVSFRFEEVELDNEEIENCAMIASYGVDFISGNEKKIGRPPAYNWDGVLFYLIGVANNPDGLPETQAGIEKLIRDFLDPNATGSPSETTIRGVAHKVMKAVGRK